MTNDEDAQNWLAAVREAIAASTLSDNDTLIAKLRIARSRIAAERSELTKAASLLDSLEAFRGIDPLVENTSSPAIARNERATQIATRLWSVDRKGVKTEAVAAELRRLGDSTNSRDLTVAVGNILSRRGWQRVQGGVYAPAGEEVAKD